ncbi:hypothetical protein [Roseibium sp.]|uniref:hypothetical protein n=1 Tax=Roseibium sp. TaxID=1936156 RepID=UPI003A969EFC
MSRLSAFCTSRSLAVIGYGEYYAVSEELCKRDLLLVSVSIRKLAEIADLRDYLRRGNITLVEFGAGRAIKASISVWDILGNIIHGVELRVLKIKNELSSDEDLLRAMADKSEIDAVIAIKSDKFPRRMFPLIELLKILNDFMEEVEEKLSENGVFVGSGYDF